MYRCRGHCSSDRPRAAVQPGWTSVERWTCHQRLCPIGSRFWSASQERIVSTVPDWRSQSSPRSRLVCVATARLDLNQSASFPDGTICGINAIGTRITVKPGILPIRDCLAANAQVIGLFYRQGDEDGPTCPVRLGVPGPRCLAARRVRSPHVPFVPSLGVGPWRRICSGTRRPPASCR